MWNKNECVERLFIETKFNESEDILVQKFQTS